MRTIASILFAVTAALGVTAAEPKADDKSKPNILFIVSEDNGDHLGCYGEERVHTPHLDALAAGGVRYARAYVPYSVCSPSRAAYLTGLYTRQTGHIGLATHRFAMYRDFKTMPAFFQQAGYYTGFLGKTHINPERLVEDYVDHRAIRNSNFGKTISIETYAEEAGVVMQNAAESKKPFFLIINYADAHRRFVSKSKNGFPTRQVTDAIAPFPWIGSDTPHLREELRDYFNCMNRLDEGVGMVLDKLDETGHRDNTLVIYISDHGADFPRGKGSIYENGTRIPMIVNYPKSFPRGKVESGMVSTIDILPTMLRAAGLPVPDELPGIALQDVDSGKSPPRKFIHTFTTGSSPNLLYVQFGIRDERYKLVYNPDRAINRLAESRYRNSELPEDQHVKSFLHPPVYELFDLQEDPHEWKNLADSAQHKPVRERLQKAMQSFQREIKDPFGSRENIDAFISEQKEHQSKPYKKSGFRWPHLDMFKKAQETADASRQTIFEQRAIPESVPLEGHAKDAKLYGYRIPSLLVTTKGSILAFSERRLGLHDHAQNDIVLRRSTDGGKTWRDEIVAYEDGMNSINDPLTVQLANGRILLMFARFPYGRHARDAGWIKMADVGYDDPKANVLTFICHSDDDGRTWSKPVDISRQVKHPKLLNANTPGAMIQLTKGPHKGRVVTGLWGTLPIMKDGRRSREWQIVVAYSDDNGQTWKRTEPLEDASGIGFPNECQVAEAANGDIVLISRNQGGERFRKKAISHDSGETWSPLNIDRTLPSVACMGSVIRGPIRKDGTWDLWASFPSSAGRKDGQIAVSKDNGLTWRIVKVIHSPFAYSALQVSPDQTSLLCLYESNGYRTQTLIAIPLDEIDEVDEAAEKLSHPNVVFIMVDDLGWSDVGFNGSTVYETPNVDRLAQQGMVFSDFYSGGPVCSPTRASIMTGKYPARTGITTYLISPKRDAKHVQSHLPLEEFTIAEAFKKNGYVTGYFGKWHLGYENDCWAGNQGFDVAKGGIDLPWAWTLCYPDIKEASTARTWPKTHTRFFSPYHLTHLENGPEDEYLTERLTNETIEFIETHREEPFFAFLSFHTVHTPLQAKPEKIEKYKKKISALGLDVKKEKNGREKAFQNNAAYAAMVEHMDENVGRLLARLDELNLSDKTIVVWTSDNGGKGSVTSNLPLRGMKHNLYEGGIRVPTVFRWPKRIAAGTKNATPLISNDFYPTLLELTSRPAEPRQHVDGVSFANVLLGKSASVDRDAIYWHYPHGRNEAAVREGRYKLLQRFEQERVELYDLQVDIREGTDLSAEKPEVAQRLLGKLKSWQKSVGAKFEGDVVKRKAEKSSAAVENSKQRPNVLFISVDDWNDWVGCLEHEQAQTPNVDRLASQGLLFTNAHCVAPVCNPSRVATLTGLRPDSTGIYENNHVMRRKVPDVVTLPQYFRAKGYQVAGGGKVFHDVPPHCHDPLSWDEYFWWNEHGPKGGRSGNSWRSPYSIPPDPQPDGRPTRKITPLTKRNFDWGVVAKPESEWPDSKTAAWATEFLSREHKRPFFLAVGIFRPHVPWFNPRKYVDKYPLDSIRLPAVRDDDLDDLGPWAKKRALDRNSKHEQLVEFGEWKPAVQAYLASISFADANVGRVLDALDKSAYRDNTVVVFWSDHGYHLGEKGHWHKRTLWERSTRVPLAVVAPGVTKPGTRCSRPVSLLDLYPTLVSLCGLDARGELEGHDLTPLLKTPQRKWPHSAVTTWNPGNYSVRSERWRYILYSNGEEELYDHNSDSNEWHNLASNESYEDAKQELARHLPVATNKGGQEE